MSDFIWTDDYQVRKRISDTQFILIELRRKGMFYVVCCGLIDLRDYTDSEVKEIISQYYENHFELKEDYNENSAEVNGVIAECIFEDTDDRELTTSKEFSSIQEAEREMKKWIDLRVMDFAEKYINMEDSYV